MGKHGGKISTGKLLIPPLELYDNPTSKAYLRKAGGTCEGNYKFCLTNYFYLHLKRFFNIPKNLG
jgi:hypothetical protein